MRAQPREGSVGRYVARKTGKGWTVAFGKLDGQGKAFLIAYEATQGAKPDEFTVEERLPATRDAGYYRDASRAIDAALAELAAHFDPPKRAYNVAVLPADGGKWWVYVVPAPTRAGAWPLGGDFRFRVSADGTKIEATRQLHKSIIEVEPPKDGGNERVGGIHTHVLDSIPEDTDVFHVLTRKPNVPELVVTPKFVYSVERDGSITFAGRAEEFSKRKEE
ncbi:hypothetical protein OJF2_30630 [Aquisphaera giovannonii]|uniref:Uncharacterized protein n=1 Tax=Aquisphaera giovannonii TaxID=406548 RepID=A0A5B9W1U8_9BACT|nr:hypothetical protein [Aquisphaera giovannonii]QEH34523.1 hypothetical protein OJF2_30630 [Aquisphaera giovannonii]